MSFETLWYPVLLAFFSKLQYFNFGKTLLYQDVANSVGPFAAVLAAKDGELDKKAEVPLWVFFIAGKKQ